VALSAGPADPLPRMWAPPEGRARMRVDPSRAPYRPVRPAAFASTDFAMVKICVSRAGEVTDVHVLDGEASRFADEIVAKVATWRFDPAIIDGRAVPFCYV